MDILTLSMAKAYSDEKGGYTEKKTLTNDGNNEGKESLDAVDIPTVRIVEVIDPYTITEVTMLYNGETLVFPKDQLVVTEHNDCETSVSVDGNIGVLILEENNNYGASAGTYVASAMEIGVCVTRIETETIHPIDPKYLPEGIGGGLPVVELTTRLATGVTLTEEESAALTAVYESEVPVAVVKAPFVWGSGSWNTAFVAEKSVLSGGFDILTAQVGTSGGETYRIDLERNYSAGLWSATVEKINGILPFVDVKTNLSNGKTITGDIATALLYACNTGMPIVIKALYENPADAWGDYITITAVFQNALVDGVKKLTAQINGSNVVLEYKSSSWTCSVSS